MTNRFSELPDDDRQAFAHAKAPAIEAISRRNDPRIQATMARVLRNRAMPDSAKTRALYDAVAPLADDLGKQAVCRKGCSHCCHIAVAINQAEADLIGRATGREPAKPVNRMTERRAEFAEAIPLGYGNPCPFLVNNECSIYDARPLACRMHFNLDVSPDLCKLDNSRPVLLYDNLKTFMAGVMAAGGPHKVTIADIREFFPKEPDHDDKP
jgi:Fe-S-cluster containining protein